MTCTVAVRVQAHWTTRIFDPPSDVDIQRAVPASGTRKSFGVNKCATTMEVTHGGMPTGIDVSSMFADV